MREGKCCGVVEGPTAAAQKRKSGHPWVVQKLMVVIVFGLLVYGAYIYIGRLCVPMIKRRSDAGAGRGTGIALTLVFVILYLWVVWAYIKVVITPPGFAKDCATMSERPLIPAKVMLNESYSTATPNPDTDMELGHRDQHFSQPQSIRGLAGPSYEDLTKKNESIVGAGEIIKPSQGPEVNDVGSSPPMNDTQRSSVTISASGTQPLDAIDKHSTKAEIHLHRRPPTTAVLQPLHRYCLTDELVKPYRAHHCRSCGTCVLKFDHHCPWIGQCVGARNHKFFINFCQAIIVFTFFSLATVVVFLVRINDAGGNLDPQKIAGIAMGTFFLLFAVIMLITHVHLILTGMTTVEMMQKESMDIREKKLLRKFYAWWEFRAKARKLREWDKEWGALSTEGNIWWKGSRYAEWVDVMGVSWLGWIFPVGRGLSDGLTYPVNPRFDAEGRWRRRADWPEELR